MDEFDGQPLLVVRVIRTGGFGGLRREWQFEATSADDAQAWWPLVEACPWDATAGPCGPDAFVYELRANDREVTLAEQQVDGPWRELIDAVVHHAD